MDLLNLANILRQKAHRQGAENCSIAPRAVSFSNRFGLQAQDGADFATAAAGPLGIQQLFASNGSSCVTPVLPDLSATHDFPASGFSHSSRSSSSNSSGALSSMAGPGTDDKTDYAADNEAGAASHNADDLASDLDLNPMARLLDGLRAENERLRARLEEQANQLAERDAALDRLRADVADLEEARALYRDQLAQLCIALPPTATDANQNNRYKSQRTDEHLAQRQEQQQLPHSPCDAPSNLRDASELLWPFASCDHPGTGTAGEFSALSLLGSLPECEDAIGSEHANPHGSCGDVTPSATVSSTKGYADATSGFSTRSMFKRLFLPGDTPSEETKQQTQTTPRASALACRTVSCSALSIGVCSLTPRYLPGGTALPSSAFLSGSNWQGSGNLDVGAINPSNTTHGTAGDAAGRGQGSAAVPLHAAAASSSARHTGHVLGRVAAARRRSSYVWRRSASSIAPATAAAPAAPFASRLGGGGVSEGGPRAEPRSPAAVPCTAQRGPGEAGVASFDKAPLRRQNTASAVSISTYMMTFSDSF